MSMEHWWNYTDRGKPKYLKEKPQSDTLPTANPTSTGLGTNLALRVQRPATNGPTWHGLVLGLVH